MVLRLVQFLAIVFAAVALVPAGAHLFELPNKIGLSQEQYFIIQQIYRGWALFGFVLFPALAFALALTVMLRDHGARTLAGIAFASLAATLVIFFTWTFPANQATGNWTSAPANWAELRTQWEYSHAVNAGLAFVAVCSLTLSALLGRE